MEGATQATQGAGMSQIAAGHIALAVCFVLYLVWWFIFFHPADQKPQGVLRIFGIACIIVAAVLGVVGVGLIIGGITALPPLTTGLRTWQIVLGGMALYVALFVITTIPLDRPPTTELIIICAWVTLELATLNALYGSGSLAAGVTLAMMLVVLAGLAVSMVCYVRYYALQGWPALIDGCVPLVCGIIVGIAMAIVVA